MSPQYLDVASIRIVSNTGEMIPLSVLIVPKIAAPLQCISSSKLQELPYLRNLRLRDTERLLSRIDVSTIVYRLLHNCKQSRAGRVQQYDWL